MIAARAACLSLLLALAACSGGGGRFDGAYGGISGGLATGGR